MIFAVSILHLSTANAQQSKQTFTFTLTTEDLQVIGKALDERPFKEAAPLIQKLNTQIQTQTAPVKEKEQATPQAVPPVQ